MIFLSMNINMENIGVVSSEWMYEFLIENVDSHFSMADGNKFAINTDGMWYFEYQGDHKYVMNRVLKE